jgi:hypothetical protein
MKVNKWTTALASAGVIGGALAVQAEETPVMTALSSTTISGFVDTSMHWNLGTGNANPAQFGFNFPSKQDGFNLNQVNLQIGKAMDEGQWAAGYKAELMFGPNAVAYNPSFNSDGTSDFAVKQAYVELRAPVGNGLDFKVGVFDAIIGYEYGNSVDNPNYTASYGWSIEPTQHTGVLMSYQFNDMISASAGVANSVFAGVNSRGSYLGAGTVGTKAESQKTWMGSVAVTAPESMGWFSGSTLYGGIVYGFPAGGTAGTGPGSIGNQNQVNYFVGGTMTTPWEQLSLGVAWDYAGASANTTGTGSGVAATQSYYQNVFALYASYQATEKLSLHARGEYGSGDLLYAQANGENGQVWAGTLTAQYELWANVITRAEVRWDQANSNQFGGRAPWAGGNGTTDASKSNDFMAAIQIAYLF